MFNHCVKRIRLRFFSTSSLLEAYELLLHWKGSKREEFDSIENSNLALELIIDELKRRGYGSLIGD